MKIRELVLRTQISKETVHYYIREGLLPRPPKHGRNVADYDESYIERIRLIKELQDNYFLPLSMIKKIMKKPGKSSEGQSFLRLRSEYFRPVDQLLPSEIRGENAFQEATGLGGKWLSKMEEWGIITPTLRDGQKIYYQDDITLAKLFVRMDKIGVGASDDGRFQSKTTAVLGVNDKDGRYEWDVKTVLLCTADQPVTLTWIEFNNVYPGGCGRCFLFAPQKQFTHTLMVDRDGVTYASPITCSSVGLKAMLVTRPAI